MAKREKQPEPPKTPITQGSQEEFFLIDGGDIPPGWGPQLHPDRSEFVEKEREEKAKAGFIESRAEWIKGTFGQGMAWGRPCYQLSDAVDSEGKTFDLLRLPESTVLYKSLGFKAIGARMQIVYRGKVKLKDGNKAMRWDVKLADRAMQLSAPRKDALILMSPELREALQQIDEMKAEMAELTAEAHIKRLTAQKQRLLTGEIDDVDTTPDFSDFDAAFGPPSSKFRDG